jgi:putative endonuclease
VRDPRKYWVYIVASRSGTLYIGVTGNLQARVAQHKSGEIEGFTHDYKCNRLVYGRAMKMYSGQLDGRSS